MKDMQRRNIIVRLEKCRNKNKEFYNKYPNLLKELDYKIEALKNGVELPREVNLEELKYLIGLFSIKRPIGINS